MKTIINLGVVLSLCGTSAFAFSGREIASSKYLQKKVSANSGQCADFSGTWHGSCTLDGQAAGDHYLKVIQLGCAAVYFNSDVVVAGGLKTEALTIPSEKGAVSVSAVSAAEWSQDGQILAGGGGGFAKHIGGDSQGSFQGAGYVRLNAGRLESELKVFDKTIRCAYDKH